MLLLPLRWPFSCSFTLRSCFAHILLPREVACFSSCYLKRFWLCYVLVNLALYICSNLRKWLGYVSVTF